MDVDLESMELSDLKDLKKHLDRAISNFEERAKAKARNAAEEAARAHGFAFSELFGSQKRKASRGRAAGAAEPRFRHPENEELTWSGRGRRPAWFNDVLASGCSEDELRI